MQQIVLHDHWRELIAMRLDRTRSAWVSMGKKSRSVLVLGYPHFARRMATLIDGDGWHASILERDFSANRARRAWEKANLLVRIPSYDIVYQIGGPEVDDRIRSACAIIGRPIVLHWVGTDVLVARKNLEPVAVSAEATEHWADCSWLAGELEELGINAKVFPSCGVEAVVVPKLPPPPLTVLAYLPDGKSDFYGGRTITSLAAKLPDVQFRVVASKGDRQAVQDNLS